MQLTQRETTVFDLLNKKQRFGMEFSEQESLAFGLLQKKSKFQDLSFEDKRRQIIGDKAVSKDVPPEGKVESFLKPLKGPEPFEVKAGKEILKIPRRFEAGVEIGARKVLGKEVPQELIQEAIEPKETSLLDLAGTQRRIPKLIEEISPDITPQEAAERTRRPGPVLAVQMFKEPLKEIADLAVFSISPDKVLFMFPVFNLAIKGLGWPIKKLIGVIRKSKIVKGDSVVKATEKVKTAVAKEAKIPKKQIDDALVIVRETEDTIVVKAKIPPKLKAEIGVAKKKADSVLQEFKDLQTPSTIKKDVRGGLIKKLDDFGDFSNETLSKNALSSEALFTSRVADNLNFTQAEHNSLFLREEFTNVIEKVRDIARNSPVKDIRKNLFKEADEFSKLLSKELKIKRGTKIEAPTTEKFAGIDPFKLFKEKPLNPNAIGVKVKDLVKERAFNIDKAFLDSEEFIRHFDVKLTRLEREALPFIRQGIKDVNVLKKIGREELIPIIKNPSKELIKHNEKLGKYYDDAHAFLKENFDNVGFVENYVTQIWDIPKNRRSEVLNYFTTRNPFTKKRVIPSLEEGIKLGLKPKTTDISQLLRTYDQYKIKTAFNLKFANSLKNMVDSETGLKVMMRFDKAPTDWVTIDHPALNRAMAIGKPGKEGLILTKVPVKVNPEIASEVKAVFSKPFKAPVIGAIETINAFTKKSMLSFSFFHHFALTESAFSSGIGKKAISMWNPYKIIRALKNRDYEIFKRMPMAKDSIDHGVVYGALPDFQTARVRQGLLSVERATKKIPVVGQAAKAVRTANDLWDKSLWDYYHNTLKLFAYEKQSLRALKAGNKITQKQFGRDMVRAEIEEVKNQIGKFVNDSFGGQRWELQRFFNDARNRQMIHWLLLAPDWTFSVLKQAFAPVKGHLLSVGGSTLERQLAGKVLEKRGISFWVKAVLYYNLVSQSVNLFNTKRITWENGQQVSNFNGEPRFTWENDPGHKLDVFAGFNPDGTKRYIRPGKQFREVMEWSYEPERKLGAKLSPVLRETMRQATKADPGSGFPTKFAKQEFFASIPERLKSIAITGIPFSMRHLVQGSPKNFMFTLPASKGMTNFKTVDLFKKAIRKGDINRASEVYFAALENNLDAQNLFKTAKSSIKADMTMDNKKFAKRILGELRVLDNPQDQRDLYNHYKARGIITPAIEKIFRDMVRKETSIQRQRKSVGIQ